MHWRDLEGMLKFYLMSIDVLGCKMSLHTQARAHTHAHEDKHTHGHNTHTPVVYTHARTISGDPLSLNVVKPSVYLS